MKGIFNIEELILQTRDSNSRQYIEEAYSAYKGGAFRASIVSVWIAIVFDIISKLRELAENGDKLASKNIKQLDEIIELSNNDKTKVKKLQEFESNILELVFNDFELMNGTEYKLLQRIKEDRNICAHPAYVDSQMLFEPTAELVRSHIVHSIEFLLKIKPVQGKAAFDQIVKDLKRESFPKDFENARKYLKSKYFNRIKDVLVKNLCQGLLIGLLKGEVDEQDQMLNVNNTLAIIALEFPSVYDNVIAEKFDKITGNVADDCLWNVILFLSKNPKSWDSLDLHNQLRIIEFVRLIPLKSNKLFENYNSLTSISIPQLNEALKDKIDTIKEIAIQGIDKYGNSSSYSSSLKNGKKYILPNISYFGVEHIEYFIKVILESKSNQILPAAGSEMIIESVFSGTSHLKAQTLTYWKKMLPKMKELDNKYISLIRKIESDI